MSTTYSLCKKMLLNIELAAKIGSRLIESLPLLDSLRRWSEKAKGQNRYHGLPRYRTRKDR